MKKSIFKIILLTILSTSLCLSGCKKADKDISSTGDTNINKVADNSAINNVWLNNDQFGKEDESEENLSSERTDEYVELEDIESNENSENVININLESDEYDLDNDCFYLRCSQERPNTDFSFQKYYDYMLNSTDGNAVFSPISANISFCMSSKTLDDYNQKQITSFIGERAYLKYETSDNMKIVNRLWVNNSDIYTQYINNIKNKFDNPDIVYPIDMTVDPLKSTEIKNKFVAKETNDFIKSTPTVFGPDLKQDAMSIIYFKNKWDNKKELDNYTTKFYSQNGNVSKLNMFTEEDGQKYYKSNDSVAYEMAYDGSQRFVAILPNENVKLEDINIEKYIKTNLLNEPVENVSIIDNPVIFKMPEFEADVTYDNIDISTFGVNLKLYDEEIKMTQVAKIKVDNEGTEAAAVTEMPMWCGGPAEIEEKRTPIEITLNRPFIYFITDLRNNDVAFIGVVKNL